MAVKFEETTQETELLNRVTINLRYVAGDLNSLAEAFASSQGDIEGLTKTLDNCIAMLLAARRAVPPMGTSNRGADGAMKSAKGFRPYRPVQVRERAQWRYFVAAGEASSSGSHSFEPRVEIRLQILDVFETDGKS